MISTPFIFVLSFSTFIWLVYLISFFSLLQRYSSYNVYVNILGHTSGRLSSHLSGVPVSFFVQQIIDLYTVACEGFILSKVQGFLALVKLLAPFCKRIPF